MMHGSSSKRLSPKVKIGLKVRVSALKLRYYFNSSLNEVWEKIHHVDSNRRARAARPETVCGLMEGSHGDKLVRSLLSEQLHSLTDNINLDLAKVTNVVTNLDITLMKATPGQRKCDKN